MGGRGSGGGRGGRASAGGGGGALGSATPPKFVNINQYYQEQYSKMTDLELNRAYVNAKNLMKKEQANVSLEQKRLAKMVDEYNAMSNKDPRLDKKWDAIDKQTSKLNNAMSKAEIRSQAYLWAVNEKYNIRGKYNPNDMKSMTNGQLNSYYNRMYKEGSKAKAKAERTNNPKTRAKYEKIYKEYSQNFNKANAEKEKRGLWGIDW